MTSNPHLLGSRSWQGMHTLAKELPQRVVPTLWLRYPSDAQTSQPGVNRGRGKKCHGSQKGVHTESLWIPKQVEVIEIRESASSSDARERWHENEKFKLTNEYSTDSKRSKITASRDLGFQRTWIAHVRRNSKKS